MHLPPLICPLISMRVTPPPRASFNALPIQTKKEARCVDPQFGEGSRPKVDPRAAQLTVNSGASSR